ncbi:Polycystin-1 [Collichthys lucidus]|uniref:Polycystin-1 n=1 Tax=Collichthys lucidus TaxID=240159 RepID=A0A4U5VQD5_COLLU|nr:Polycystin-1 [Collichthys lucidus]
MPEEDLLMSIAAAAEDTADLTKSNSDSGRDSPKTTSSLSNTSTSCSSWSEQSEDKSLYGAEIHKQDPQSCPTLYGAGLYKCPSVLSVDSVASTFLPSPSPDSTRSPSTTRIGVARGQPCWLLPPWALCVIYPLVAVLLGACLAVVGLYGSFLSRTVVLMWLVSALSAFLTSALLLEPLKTLIYTAVWRPVDPEVEDQLAQETTVVRSFGEHGGKVRPLCGYGLLQAKEEARKVRALRSLMRLLFLMLVLMVNYQDSVEQRQGRLLHSAVRRHLHTAPSGVPNLTSLRDWSDADQWIIHTLVPHLHRNPTLRLVGLPRLQYTHDLSPLRSVFLGNSSVTTHQLLTDLHMADWSEKQFKTLSIDFTHYHRESGLFVCVSMQLEWAQTHRVSPVLSIHPLLTPSSSSGLDLQVALTAFLLISALLILFGELWSMATERAQYLHQCRHWFQLLLASLSLATAILQLCFLSQATSCVSKLQSHPDIFISFHGAALLAQRCSQCAAILLTLLVLKLLGTLRFVRRWVVLGRVLQRAWRELWALTVLLLLLLLFCIHLGHTVSCQYIRPVSLSCPFFVAEWLLKDYAESTLFWVLSMGYCSWGVVFGFWPDSVELFSSVRTEQAELYCPTIEPQDYEMVEFFIKRLKLWMGLTKAKEFRHRVKFEGMDIPPSRSSQESRLSTLSSTLPSSHSPSLSSTFSSPRLLSSALSMRSEESSVSEPGFDVQPYLDRLLPCVTTLLSRFDQVNHITEAVHNLEMKLEEAQARRRKRWISNEEKGAERFSESAKPKELEGEGRQTGEVRQRKIGLFYPKAQVSLPSSFSFAPSTLHYPAAWMCIYPRKRSTYSESESLPFQALASNNNHTSETPKLASGICSLYPAGSPGFERFPRRRAWHSGSSHSADAAQRIFMNQDGVTSSDNGGEHLEFTNTRPKSEEGLRRHISDGVPVKRKAWISEGSETEQD